MSIIVIYLILSYLVCSDVLKWIVLNRLYSKIDGLLVPFAKAQDSIAKVVKLVEDTRSGAGAGVKLASKTVEMASNLRKKYFGGGLDEGETN
jgi:hypothetical protein